MKKLIKYNTIFILFVLLTIVKPNTKESVKIEEEFIKVIVENKLDNDVSGNDV